MLLLLVSEVVSNAVLHSRAPTAAPIEFRASHEQQGTIRVAVTDRGEGFTPTVRARLPYGGGYGLHFLEQVSRRWGVDRTGGTRVWFEL
jgi:anti-sigma regulatory factor (Ser/Thr protein kinase)